MTNDTIAASQATVYRIQDASGRGPFRPGFSRYWSVPRDDHQHLPTWYEEFGLAPCRQATPGEHVGCGCCTIEQLRRWFIPAEYATLLTHGYKAVQLPRVRLLASSDKQCLFVRSEPLSVGAVEFKLYEQ